MLLTPRYDDEPVLELDGAIDDQRDTVIRQRQRLVDELAALTDEQWLAPSRCAGWTVQDVISHLIGTNGFWVASIAAGLAGEPTRILAAFDPVATPAMMVEPMRATPPAETLGQLRDGVDELAAMIRRLDDAGWATIAESPPGHVPIRLVAHHALWDAWVHERDVLLPLGITPAEEPGEIVSCLRYAAPLGPCLAATAGRASLGSFVIDATDPDAHVVVEVGERSVRVHGGAAPDDAIHLSGRAVDLVEVLSIRAPFPFEIDAEHLWLFSGLAEVFDTTLEPEPA